MQIIKEVAFFPQYYLSVGSGITFFHLSKYFCVSLAFFVYFEEVLLQQWRTNSQAHKLKERPDPNSENSAVFWRVSLSLRIVTNGFIGRSLICRYFSPYKSSQSILGDQFTKVFVKMGDEILLDSCLYFTFNFLLSCMFSGHKLAFEV